MLHAYLPGGLELEEKPRNTLAQGPSLHSRNSKLLYGPRGAATGQGLARHCCLSRGSETCHQLRLSPASSQFLQPCGKGQGPKSSDPELLLTKLLCWKCPLSPVKADSSTSPHALNTSETPPNIQRLWQYMLSFLYHHVVSHSLGCCGSYPLSGSAVFLHDQNLLHP